MRLIRLLPLTALLLAGGCAYDDYATGYAPAYPSGYGPGVGPGWQAQPGDLFGGQNVASVDVFYQPLSPYGRWVDTRWGRGFIPNAPRGWRPYTNGRWAQDRFWMSGDPWGWATDHYGRWGYDQAVGWVWVPDTVWGPSWAAWRESGDVYGWAPIPPGVSWSVGMGFGTGWGGWNNWNSWYGPSWVWVPRSYVYDRGWRNHVLPWNNGPNYWRGTGWQHGPSWGWNGYGGWNGSGGWNRPGYSGWRQPQRGAPGSVGDRVGRGMVGLPPPGGYGQGWQGRPSGQGWSGTPGNGGWSAGRPGGGWAGSGAGRTGGWNGGGSVGGRIAGGMRGRRMSDVEIQGEAPAAAPQVPAYPAPPQRSWQAPQPVADRVRTEMPAYQPRMAPPRMEGPPRPEPAGRSMSMGQRIASGMTGNHERPD